MIVVSEARVGSASKQKTARVFMAVIHRTASRSIIEAGDQGLEFSCF